MKFFLLTSLLFIVFATNAHARGSGFQVTPDGHRVMIQKDIGDQRWSINFNNDDNSITGNVSSDSGPPVFLWCSPVDVTSSGIVFSCFASATCTAIRASGCSPLDWSFVSEVLLTNEFLGL